MTDEDATWKEGQAEEFMERVAALPALKQRLADAEALLSRTLSARAAHLASLHGDIEAYLAERGK